MVSQQKVGHQVIVHVNNVSLAGETAGELKDVVLDIIDRGERHIALDLGKTEYIDSSGVGKLLFLNKRLEKDEGSFSICNISDMLFDFLDSLAITKVIQIER